MMLYESHPLPGMRTNLTGMSFQEDLNQRIDRLFGPVLVSVFLGKMVGDYAAIKLTGAYGTETGYLIGIAIALAMFLLWVPLEKWLQGDYEGQRSGESGDR